ncbi:MAG: LysM peptidoglycan-binding domain-containing protein [Halothiobacillus sp.]
MRFFVDIPAKSPRLPGVLFIGLLFLGVLSGCAQVPSSGEGDTSKEATHSATPDLSSADSAGDAAPAPLMDLKKIIHLIEEGQSDFARRALKTYLAKDPKNTQALSLQQQLTVNPEAYLGKPTTTYTVQPGDTLGGIAAKFLGNPLRFVILGRYNQISRSKDLQVGQVIKLPARLKTNLAAPVAPESSPADVTSPDEHSVGTPSDQGVAAPALPAVQIFPADHMTPTVAPPNPGNNVPVSKDPNLAQVQQYHEAALVAYRKQNLDEAIALWNKALAIDPGYEPALGYRARALELKRRLHQLGPN